MDIMDMLLGAQNQERTITIKTKPNQERAPPETPLSADSANLPPEVLAMISQGLTGAPPAMPPPQTNALGGQMPLDMAQPVMPNPYGV